MKLSYKEVEAAIAQYVDANKIANSTLQITRNNIVGLADKVGLIATLDTSYTDKLAFMDGQDLDFGKTIEEWAIDLTLPQDYDPSGANTLAPNYPTFRNVYYSTSLGRKKVKTTIPYGNVERAVNNADQLVSVTSMIMKRLADSESVWKYGTKRQVLADLIAKCDADPNDFEDFTNTGNYDSGAYVANDSFTKIAAVVKPHKSLDTTGYNDAIAKGYLVELDLVKTIAKPVDTATGEAFVKQVKQDVEIASDLNEGHSLSGNSLGATDGLVLVVKQGLRPTLDVDVQAGAFNGEKVAIPSEIVTIKDFGTADPKVYAMLIDRRGVRLHNDYNKVRDQENADGDFINYVKHFEYTAFVSKNTFVRVYKDE